MHDLINKTMNIIILQLYYICYCCIHLGNGLPVTATDFLHTEGGAKIIDEDIKLTNLDPYSRVKDVWLRSAVTDKSKVWTNGIVPYYIDDTFFTTEEVGIINAAINEFHTKTCVRFVPRSTEMPYLFITPLSRCWSEIGMPLTEGINTLSLGQTCLQQRGTVIHELMHVIGFWHEQNRFDRDNYIDINWDNIAEGMQHNFFKYSQEKVDTLQEPYDYQSIMHYSAFAFAKDPQKQTIIPKIPTMIGQRSGLSPMDIRKIGKLYSCSSKPRPPLAAVQQRPSAITITIKPGHVTNKQDADSRIVFPDIVTDLVPLPFKFDWRKTTPITNSEIVFPTKK